MAHQTGDPRADERAEVAVLIEPGARRDCEPARHIEVMLHEDARDRERIGETWKIHRLKTVAFDCQTADQCMPADRAPDCQFGEASVVVISLRDLAILVIL